MRYFLVGPKKDAAAPSQGYGLLVVMPGGDGSAEFQAFVKRIFQHALPDGYIVAEPVAVKWTPDQQIVWPTRSDAEKGQKFSTEEFVEAVIKDVQAKQPLDKGRIFTLTWSSSGPAGYAIAMQPNTAVTGSFIAMSIFRPEQYPTLAKAKGRAFYIYHSPDDQLISLGQAEEARDALARAGAKVQLVTYQGGHGWSSGTPFEDIRKGVRWLEHPTATATAPALAAGANMKPPFTDRLETGTGAPMGWIRGAAVEGVTYLWDKNTAQDGKASLSIKKTSQRYFPIAEWSHAFPYDGTSPILNVSAMVKADKVSKAILDVQLLSGPGKDGWQHQWAAYIGAKEQGDPPATHDWKEYSGTVEIPKGTKRIIIGLQMYGPGQVWFDDVKVEYAK